MKKQLITLSLGLVSLGLVAQKSELKTAEKAIKKLDYKTAITTLNAAEKLVIAKGESKYTSKFYFLKGKALAATKDYQNAATALSSLLAMGKTKYTEKAKPILNSMIQEVSGKAVDFYNNKKDYKNAAENFYLTYLLSPKDTSFAYNAAISATQANEYDTAIKYYKELRKIGYTGIETQYLATNKLTGKVENLGSKKQRDLMVRSKQYIKPENKSTASKSAAIVKNIALLLKEQGKTDEAIAALAEARKENPKDLNLLLNEADMYIKLKQMDKFGELMKEAIALDPKNPTLYYNLGVVNFNEGMVDNAKKYYKKAIELNPEYGDAYMNLAVVVLNKDQAIVEAMNNNLNNFKKYDALALEQKEVYKEALPFLEKADTIKRSVDTVKTLMNLYEVLEMEAKATQYRTLYKAMK
ncbi:tetratricopeptide repeat protein [Tenacibaculum finnmarkense]|uniref:tetratricopeptide repeat protein n=1 Tax=Tenacibaculum finnmarkense TaxID=2781243 RepID=UPI001E2837A6|nr:tetratricopeptide repeat protein [Tenacibaculum finnmarkense]MCD8411512.1 tetratricopeptide repeat protein [Tenacibaculum finnmarkense genomovar ulcerans]MCG8208157.1 tetratricopeptide repeat protein [Tenacibaculum finnmarkense genomovar finnmarkense]MCG8724153.1 tetratricopeptide repeat protein [Tenacibaculum finnmarkense]MCG8741463.1 tetratricopeptide repeat protein [Tenacibaculum finnmarkense]MCG8765867.1 tetratricopeptide repeat protein [Tenacibaculum finnmarkense]